MNLILLQNYDVKTELAFVFKGSTVEYVVSDVVSHGWNADTKSVEILSDPKVVFRSVSNINHPTPVPHERIELPLSVFKANEPTYRTISERISGNKRD